MNLSLLSEINWAVGASLEATVLCLAWRRKLAPQLPFFVAYLVLLVANECIMFVIFKTSGFTSRTSLFCYWTLQALLLSLRATVVYEICRNVLGPFAGIWRLVSRSLFAIAAVLGLAVVTSSRAELQYLGSAILAG